MVSALEVHLWGVVTLADRPDCGRYSDENGSPTCERMVQGSLGVALVVGVLLVALVWVLWRRRVARAERTSDDTGGVIAADAGSDSDVEQRQLDARDSY